MAFADYLELKARWRALGDEIRALERRRRDLVDEAYRRSVEALAQSGETWDQIRAIVLGRIQAADLAVGGWTCQSPDNLLGQCLYDDQADPAHDDCVFCGHPEERK